MTQSEARPALAAILGYGGLVPFVAAAAAVAIGVRPDVAHGVFVAYGATILAFLGGIQWGLAALAYDGRVGERLVVGVCPSLVAWVALLARPLPGVILLAAGLAAIYAYDRLRNVELLPPWLAALRRDLTVVALLCHAVVAVAGP